MLRSMVLGRARYLRKLVGHSANARRNRQYLLVGGACIGVTKGLSKEWYIFAISLRVLDFVLCSILLGVGRLRVIDLLNPLH